MRRLLRKIACKEISPEQLGDTTTLAEPSIFFFLKKKYSSI